VQLCARYICLCLVLSTRDGPFIVCRRPYKKVLSWAAVNISNWYSITRVVSLWAMNEERMCHCYNHTNKCITFICTVYTVDKTYDCSREMCARNRGRVQIFGQKCDCRFCACNVCVCVGARACVTKYSSSVRSKTHLAFLCLSFRSPRPGRVWCA
jgi:hypothetical protein